MYKNFEVNYKKLVSDVYNLHPAYKKVGRNGTTLSSFGHQLKFDELTRGRFPLITARKMYPKGIAGEMAAFLKGPKHLDDFTSQGCNYWSNWAEADGSINVDYGNAWTDFEGVNQLEQLVDGLKNNPHGRRHIVTAWNPKNLDNLSLPCCHWAYQFYVTPLGNLDMIWIQRSVDLMIGLPSDIMLAALLNILVANETGYKPGTITMQLGDCHIYEEHMPHVSTYLDAYNHAPPTYKLKDGLFNFSPDSLELIDYEHGDPIKFELKG